MKKTIKVNRNDYHVIDKTQKINIDPNFLKLIKKGLVAIQDYSGIKRKPKIFYATGESENFAEYFGISKRRPKIVIYIETFKNVDANDLEKSIVTAIIHEYLHFVFDKKKMSRFLSIETEEELIERIEEDVWTKYFT